MQAVEELLASRRWHEITTDEVAAAAKVGKGTLYKHFADKDDLFFQTATAGFDDLLGLLQLRVSNEAPFEQQLLEACGEIGAFFRSRRPVFRMMHAEDGQSLWCRPEMRDRWHAKRKELLAAVASIMQRGVDQGVVRSDVPVTVLASFFLGHLRNRARELGDVPEELKSNQIIVDLFCHGASTRAAATLGV